MLILHAGQVGAWRPSGRAGLDPSPGHRMPRGHSRRPISCTPHPSDPRGLTRIPGTCGCHPDISPHAPLPARPLHLQTAPGSLLFSPPPPCPARPRPVPLSLGRSPRPPRRCPRPESRPVQPVSPSSSRGVSAWPVSPRQPARTFCGFLSPQSEVQAPGRAGLLLPAPSMPKPPSRRPGARSLGTAEAGGAGPGTQRHRTAGWGDPEWPSTGGHGRGRGRPRDEGCRRRPGGPLEEVTQGQARDRGGEGRLPQVGGVVGRVPGRVESHWLTHLCRRKLP